ncbi:hypothetical protein [Roseiconus nitratireducens]|uniref:hypothetical protein n=1 Tax=Roseiconus nitratireducens TaxID=2605748 RepID=UPI00137628B5|nr:hypothetical protein [Roseiconus nitratireducens]
MNPYTPPSSSNLDREDVGSADRRHRLKPTPMEWIVVLVIAGMVAGATNQLLSGIRF